MLFRFKGHDGNTKLLSDKKIRNIVVKQSLKSNYDWIAPANELLTVCNSKAFNKSCAKDIKVAIVSCYTNLLNGYGDISSDIRYSYQAMLELKEYENDENIQNVRRLFVESYVKRAIRYVFLGDMSKTYFDVKSEWIKMKSNELLLSENSKLDFDDIKVEFINFIKNVVGIELIFENNMIAQNDYRIVDLFKDQDNVKEKQDAVKTIATKKNTNTKN